MPKFCIVLVSDSSLYPSMERSIVLISNSPEKYLHKVIRFIHEGKSYHFAFSTIVYFFHCDGQNHIK